MSGWGEKHKKGPRGRKENGKMCEKPVFPCPHSVDLFFTLRESMAVYPRAQQRRKILSKDGPRESGRQEKGWERGVCGGKWREGKGAPGAEPQNPGGREAKSCVRQAATPRSGAFPFA